MTAPSSTINSNFSDLHAFMQVISKWLRRYIASSVVGGPPLSLVLVAVSTVVSKPMRAGPSFQALYLKAFARHACPGSTLSSRYFHVALNGMRTSGGMQSRTAPPAPPVPPAPPTPPAPPVPPVPP